MANRPIRFNDTTVKDEWVGFSDLVLTEKHPASQFKEMRRAFYAGYLGGATAMSEIIQSQGWEAALDWCNKVAMGEIKTFFDEIEKGTK